ncbi:MAG: adenosylmethionine--8-amino-7-oxononanoate transaminase [Proteobacteria bacterium]|nr:adenosylmethionine--8-amino-7-oxononanoate transaminase [Pseudomonadota bacterium]
MTSTTTSTRTRDEIVALDKRLIWRPYTRMDTYIRDAQPVVARAASGIYIDDMDGTRYIDGNGSWWTNIVGHNHPHLMAALNECTRTLTHCTFADVTHEDAVALAEKLLPLLGPSFARLFFSDDGSTAVEVAVRMAYQYWRNVGRPQKHRFVTFEGAFHGETLGCASVSGVPVFHTGLGDLVFDSVRLPSPARCAEAEHPDTALAETFRAAEQLLQERADEIAAVIIEPLIQGAAGMLMYPPHYLKRLASLCRQQDVLLIVDEVFTGYGRTGTFLAQHQAEINADITCLAKGFSGGVLPMAATAASQRVFDAFLGSAEKTLWYGHSFTGNPLGCAVALATLEVIQDQDLVAKSHAAGQRLQQRLDALAERFSFVRAPRRYGLVGAFTLNFGDDARSNDYLDDAGWRFYAAAKQHGALLRPLGNVVYFVLPLTITTAEVDALGDIVERALVTAFPQAI